ncbi:MAG: chorismate synthase [Deltaproteobacteria bacterium]|nr:chorismate synthase [Deltaproteobacteria bacterium]
MSSTFGTIFKITTFGESHCKSVGVVVDGCPSGIELSEEDIQPQLTRRRPGQSALSTPRDEKDSVIILSGVENGLTLGTPIAMIVNNRDQKPGDYSEMADIPRPSHADFTYQTKYGIRASSGGGRSSARETIGRVAAGALAQKILDKYGIEIVAYVDSVGDVKSGSVDLKSITRENVETNAVRCPDIKAADKMITYIEELKELKDSVGGVVTCVCRNVPAGLGEPVFDKLEASLAQAMLSIPATKGFEIGSGFEGTKMRGSIHNDPFLMTDGKLRTSSNNSGGIQGGISNGEDIFFRVAFKPPATIGMEQKTVTFKGENVTLSAKGRHDPCVVPRAVPIVESMASLVIADMILRQKRFL